MFNHTGTTIIKGKNIILRRFKSSDAEQMFNNWASLDVVTENLPWKSHKNIHKTKFVIDTWIKYYKKADYYNWCIESKEGSETLGSISLSDFNTDDLSCQVGYCLGYKFWNKGIMTEALNLILDYSFYTLNCEIIKSTVYYRNIQSCRVLKKCGFEFKEVKNVDAKEYKFFRIKKSSYVNNVEKQGNML